MTDELAARRELDTSVWRRYRDCITDWCGHDLAVEITAEKLGISKKTVRTIVAAHDNSTFL